VLTLGERRRRAGQEVGVSEVRGRQAGFVLQYSYIHTA